MSSKATQDAVEAALEADRESSLRDMFATAALGAILSRDGTSTMAIYQKGQVAMAYSYADAMMEVRKGNS